MLPEFDNTAIAFQYRSNKDLKQAWFLFSSMSSPLLTKIGLAATQLAINLHLPVNTLIKKTIFQQFCGGEDLAEAAVKANMLAQYHVGVILDYGVEGKGTEADFDNAVPEFIKAINYAAGQKNIPFISLKVTGFAHFALLEKINTDQALTPAEQEAWAKVYKRIDAICAVAAEKNIMVLIDAEETWIATPVHELAEAMMKKYNKGKVIVFNTYQMYCHSTLSFLEETIQKAKAEGYILGAKLVRGAYMEKERKRAKEMGYTDPIQPNKESTDRDYNDAVTLCMHNLDNLWVFIGTHNEKSCLLGATYMDAHKIDPNAPSVWFSQLYGMSDNISFNLAHAGYNVAKYLPYGPVKDVIPYLMRRAQENTSVAGQTGRELSLIKKEVKRRRIA